MSNETYSHISHVSQNSKISRNSTQNNLKNDKKSIFKGCTCKMSNCMKKYCICYSNNGVCSEECKCFECLNNIGNINLKKLKIEKKEINGKNNNKNHNILKKIVTSCNCKKVRCQKKYCECFNSGNGCSESCKCEGCKNPIKLI